MFQSIVMSAQPTFSVNKDLKCCMQLTYDMEFSKNEIQLYNTLTIVNPQEVMQTRASK